MKPWLTLAGALALFPACAAIWGFEDGVLAEGEGVDGSTPGADGSAQQDAGIDLDAVSDAAPPNCGNRVPDPQGYFVDLNSGRDAPGCGEPNAPCGSVAWVFEHYEARFHPIVHVAVAEYTGSLVLPESARRLGLVVDGRWGVRIQGAERVWQPYCGDVPTRLVGDGSETVRVESRYEVPPLPVQEDRDAGEADDAGDAEADAGADLDATTAPAEPYDLVLSSLVLSTKPEAAPGETLYALFAANAYVKLVDCALVAAAGGHGKDGADGVAGANGGTSCPADPTRPARGKGTDGSSGEDATVPTTAGAFTPQGYRGSSGPPGGAGTRGGNGGPVASGCVTAPTAGCGGEPGSPGGGGEAGGASIGAYLSAARLELVRTSTASGPGGNGGNGGNGSGGGSGGAGTPGLVCGLNLLPQGSTGGRGGASGAGAGGAGGASVCLAAVAGSRVEGFEPELCEHAAPGGAGGSGPGEEKAPDGNAGALYTEPDGGTEPSP